MKGYARRRAGTKVSLVFRKLFLTPTDTRKQDSPSETRDARKMLEGAYNFV